MNRTVIFSNMIYRLRGQLPSSCFTATTVIFLHQYLTGPIIFMLQYKGIPLFFVFVLFWYPMHCVHQRHELSASSSDFVSRRPNFGFRQTGRHADGRTVLVFYALCASTSCIVCIIVRFCFQTTKFWFQTDGRTDRQTQ